MLYPVRQSDIMPKVSAPVQQFYANRGDHVLEGQLLAVLENRDLKATAAANQGQLAQAQANLRNTAGATVPEEVVKAQADVQASQQQTDAARKLLNSRRELFEQGALARRLVDEAQVAYANAEAQLETNREHLRALQSVGKQEQIQAAQAQVEAARGQPADRRVAGRLHRNPQPHRGRGGRTPAVRGRYGQHRPAAVRHHEHRPDCGARQRAGGAVVPAAGGRSGHSSARRKAASSFPAR